MLAGRQASGPAARQPGRQAGRQPGSQANHPSHPSSHPASSRPSIHRTHQSARGCQSQASKHWEHKTLRVLRRNGCCAALRPSWMTSPSQPPNPIPTAHQPHHQPKPLADKAHNPGNRRDSGATAGRDELQGTGALSVGGTPTESGHQTCRPKAPPSLARSCD